MSMPAVAVECPLCDERLWESRSPVTVPFLTIIRTDVWPPADIHICKKDDEHGQEQEAQEAERQPRQAGSAAGALARRRRRLDPH